MPYQTSDNKDETPITFARMRNSTAYRWWLVAMLWCVCFLNYADRQAIFSVFTPLQAEFHLSDIQLAMLASAFIWVYALSGPLTGWIADRISRKAIILAALAFWSVVTAAVAVSRDFHTLVVLRALSGFGEAFYFPAAMSLLASYHSATTRSRAMSIHQTAIYGGTIAGGALSAYIAQHAGWRSSFSLFGAAGILLTLVLSFTLRTPQEDSEKASPQEAPESFLGGLRDTLRDGPAMTQIGAFVAANSVAVVFLTWLPTYVQRTFHLSLASSGFNSTVYLQIASVAGVLLGGVLTDRLRLRWIAARQIMHFIAMACGVPFLFLAGWSHALKTFALCMIGFGFFKGLYEANLWASLYDVVPKNRKGIAGGLMNSLGWLGGGIAPIAVAALAARTSLATCLSATSVLYAANAVVFLRLARWRINHASDENT